MAGACLQGQQTWGTSYHMGSSVGSKSSFFFCVAIHSLLTASLLYLLLFSLLYLICVSHLFHPPLVTLWNHTGFLLTSSLLIQSCSSPELSCYSRSFFFRDRLGVRALCSAQCFAGIVQSTSAQWNQIFPAGQMIPD